MFGQHNDKHSDNHQIPEDSIQGVMHGEDHHAPVPAHDQQSNWGHPGQPIDTNQVAPNSQPPEVIAPGSTPAEVSKHASEMHDPAPKDTPQNAPTNNNVPHDLIDIKQKALSQLSPLVDHLDQSPEDKFRTTMMMIQASDDQSLVQSAYDAAQKIQDEKTRAQALLDIVNEINYFTQNNK